MTNKEIEEYINTYRLYPDEYTGKRDINILKALEGTYRYYPDTNMIIRSEGRINANGDYEITGRFMFPDGHPELKEIAPDYDIKNAKTIYLRILEKLDLEPVLDPNWTLRDMVAEIDSIKSTYHDKNHPNHKLRHTDFREFDSRYRRLQHFIKKYSPHIEDMELYTTHNSRFG